MRVLITGIHGMDGQLLARYYHDAGARVIGWARPGSTLPMPYGVEALVAGSPEHEADVVAALRTCCPDVIVHLAAVHHSSQGGNGDPVALSAAMWRLNCLAVNHFIQGIIHHHPQCRLICAGSSQMYQATSGQDITIIDELTPIRPRTEYAVGKMAALSAVRFARQYHGVQAAMAFLFNHESPLRGPSFVTRKISMAAAQAARGKKPQLSLMNIGARVDWSDARDIVAGLAMMAAAPVMDDFVLGAGRLYTIHDVLDMAFMPLGLDWQDYVMAQNDHPEPAFMANPARAVNELGWQPTSDIAPVIAQMVEADLAAGH